MPDIKPIIWGLTVLFVALLNIADILPDWTTITAILTLPFLSVATGSKCRRASRTPAR